MLGCGVNIFWFGGLFVLGINKYKCPTYIKVSSIWHGCLHTGPYRVDLEKNDEYIYSFVITCGTSRDSHSGHTGGGLVKMTKCPDGRFPSSVPRASLTTDGFSICI